MIPVIDHIEYLLMHHECVVVPNFGAFIVGVQSSDIQSDNSSSIVMPKRSVSFNSMINHNDGLLANSIIRRERIPYNKALAEIDQAVQFFSQQLRENGTVLLGNIGIFSLVDEGQIIFSPSEQNSLNFGTFGLHELSMPTLETLHTKENELAESYSVSQQRWTFSSVFQTAATIIILFCLAFALSTPLPIDRVETNQAGISLPAIKKAPTQKIKVINSVAVEQSANSNSNQEKVDIEEQSGRYYLIVATLRTQNQVQQFLRENKTLDLKTKKIGKYYRVYIAQSNDYHALEKEKSALPSGFSDAWISD